MRPPRHRLLALVRTLFRTAMVLACAAHFCQAQRAALDAKSVVLRLIITVETDTAKAAQVTVELMDAVGLSSAMDRKITDNDGGVSFRTLTGVHRIRISGPNVQTFEGEVEIANNETVHVERIRLRRLNNDRPVTELQPTASIPAIRLNIPASARKTYEKGTDAMRNQLWEKSRDYFEAAIRTYPQYDLAYNGLGAVEMQMNEVEAARRAFTKALEINPDFAGANRNLARILLSERNAQDAAPLLKRSLTTEPDNAWALTNLANCEFLLLHYNEAVLYARKAHTVPHKEFPLVHMVAARALEASNQPAAAVAEYRLYLQEDPKGRDAERAQAAIDRLRDAASQ